MTMQNSRPAAIVAVLFAMAFAMSPVCFESFAGVADTSSGCNGHHRPIPAPSPAHNCCVAAHQVPAIVPIAQFQAGLDACETDIVEAAAVDQCHHAEAARVPAVDSSPPLTAVLRI